MRPLFGAPPPRGEKSFAAWKNKPGYSPQKVGVVRAVTKQQAERKAAILFGRYAYVTEAVVTA